MSRRTVVLLSLAVVLLAAVVVAAVVDLPRPAPEAPVATPPPAAQTAPWEVAFTSPLVPDDRSAHHGGLDARLVALMDRATRTLDVADYDFDLRDVAEAMVLAARRGVRVRMVTDTDTVENVRQPEIQAAFKLLADAGIPVVPDGRQAIMHDKFTVVDGEWLQTGSWNYTDGDTYRLNNNLAIFHSPELAQNYTAEFEKMFVQRRFGPAKAKGVAFPVVDLQGTRIETYFSPQDTVARRVVERLGRAERSIHFLAFSFTHDGIGSAMLARARAGVDVQGVFETTGSNTRFSELSRMREAGLPVYQDGNPYTMHHKVILIDDRVTLFGSFNFSENADRDNDENLLVVEDPAFAAPFEAEYQRVLATARNPARTRPSPVP